MSDHHLCPRRLQEDGDADIFAHTSVKEDGGRLLDVSTDWRTLCTHYPFNFGSDCSCRPQVDCVSWMRIQLRGLADGGGRRKRKTVEATVAREERVGRGGSESQLCGEVPWRRHVCGWRCDNTLGCAREKACRRKCAVRAFGVEERAFRARWEERRERVRRRSVFVWRRECSGRAGVRAGHAGR